MIIQKQHVKTCQTKSEVNDENIFPCLLPIILPIFGEEVWMQIESNLFQSVSSLLISKDLEYDHITTFKVNFCHF